ncbi:MAG: hypothetical protein IPK07_07655 [Deltaproteobacteria bacterium]|nr:hypothetical protein [Deltaproteobacteria bacterium]
MTVPVAPALVIAQLRLYSDALVHETERSLIAESVQIGESWRQRWADTSPSSILTSPASPTRAPRRCARSRT